MMWQIEWYYCYVHGGYPGIGPRPHNLIYDLISQKIYRSTPINHIYFHSSWGDGLNVTTLMTPGVRPHPLNLTYDVRSQKPFRSPPLNHIYSFSSWCDRLNGTTVTSLGVTDGSGPSPTILLMTLYLKNKQIPTHKPYIFLFLMMCRIECYYFDVPRYLYIS